MKREEIKNIFPDATDEQLNAVMSLNNSEIQKRQKLEADLKERTETLDKLNADFEELQKNNATAEDFKSKFEALQAEVKDREEKAKIEKEQAEKQASISTRFKNAVGDKKFRHSAIQESYLKKFGEALENSEYQGKSDNEILTALTKDDGAAFEGVTAIRLAGGANKGFENAIDTAKMRAIMGLPPVAKIERND